MPEVGDVLARQAEVTAVCAVWLARDFLHRHRRRVDIPPCPHDHCPPIREEHDMTTTVDARNLSCQALQLSIDPNVLTFHGQPVTGYADEMARRTEDHVYGCDLIGHIPVVAYEDFVVTRRQALVIKAPDVTCMSVELLRAIDSVRIVADRIHVGEDENGEPVTYRITGWDADRSALVLKRVDR